MRVIGAVSLVCLLGCRQLLGFESASGPDDGRLADEAPPPDAAPCAMVVATCASDSVLRSCVTVGELPVDATCGWGCVDDASPHCGVATFSGGAVLEGDVIPEDTLLDHTLATTVINADTGAITGVRAAGSGVIDGIDFQVRGGVGVFRFRSLTITNAITIAGTNAIAIVSASDLTLNGTIDVGGTCNTTAAGPGGFAGGTGNNDGQGGDQLRGRRGTDAGTQCSGGGGGGNGANGGDGGDSGVGGGLGGSVASDPMMAMLVGGGGGGGGGGQGADLGGAGGGGGGAIQLVSNTRITIGPAGGMRANGCGGKRGGGTNEDGGGGGGGAGGTILIEAPVVSVDGGLTVNGGGGGGGGGGIAGENGLFARIRAAGGTSPFGDGGDGGAAAILTGDRGANNIDNGGGGGGGVGRIRINTRSGTTQLGAAGLMSPAFTDAPTTATQGIPPIQ